MDEVNATSTPVPYDKESLSDVVGAPDLLVGSGEDVTTAIKRHPLEECILQQPHQHSLALQNLILKDLHPAVHAALQGLSSSHEDFINKENFSPINKFGGKFSCHSSQESISEYSQSQERSLSNPSANNSSINSASVFSRNNSFLENSLIGKLSVGWQDEPDIVALFLSGQLHKLKDTDTSCLYSEDHSAMFIAPYFEMKTSPFLQKASSPSSSKGSNWSKTCKCSLEKSNDSDKGDIGDTERLCKYCCKTTHSMDLSDLKSTVHQFREDVVSIQEKAATRSCHELQIGLSDVEHLRSMSRCSLPNAESSHCSSVGISSPASPDPAAVVDLSSTCNLFSTTIISAPQVVDSSTRFPSSPPLPPPGRDGLLLKTIPSHAAASSTMCPAKTPAKGDDNEETMPSPAGGTPFQTASTPTKASCEFDAQYTFQTPSQSVLQRDALNTPCRSRHRKVSGEQSTRLNPFDSCAEMLQLPTVSPSLFKEVISPSTAKDPDANFNWSIEQIAILNPASIEMPTCQVDTPQDPEYEKKAQEAIDKYFSRRCVLPSPWMNNIVSKALLNNEALPCKYSLPTNANCTPNALQAQPIRVYSGPAKCRGTARKPKIVRASNTVGCQTDLCLPPVLPLKLQAMLMPYMNPGLSSSTYCSSSELDSNDPGFSGNTSLRRRLLFSNDDLSSGGSPSLKCITQSSEHTKCKVLQVEADNINMASVLPSNNLADHMSYPLTSPIVSSIHPGFREHSAKVSCKDGRFRQSFSPLVGGPHSSIPFDNLSPIKLSPMPLSSSDDCEIQFRPTAEDCSPIVFPCTGSGPVISWFSPDGEDGCSAGAFGSTAKASLPTWLASPELSPIKSAGSHDDQADHCSIGDVTAIAAPAVQDGDKCDVPTADVVPVGESSLLTISGSDRYTASGPSTSAGTVVDCFSERLSYTPSRFSSKDLTSGAVEVRGHNVPSSGVITSSGSCGLSYQHFSNNCDNLHPGCNSLTNCSQQNSQCESSEHLSPSGHFSSRSTYLSPSSDSRLQSPSVGEYSAAAASSVAYHQSCCNKEIVSRLVFKGEVTPKRIKSVVGFQHRGNNLQASQERMAPLSHREQLVAGHQHRTPVQCSSREEGWKKRSSADENSPPAGHSPQTPQFSSSPIRDCQSGGIGESTQLFSPASRCSTSPFGAPPCVSPIPHRRGRARHSPRILQENTALGMRIVSNDAAVERCNNREASVDSNRCANDCSPGNNFHETSLDGLKGKCLIDCSAEGGIRSARKTSVIANSSTRSSTSPLMNRPLSSIDNTRTASSLSSPSTVTHGDTRYFSDAGTTPTRSAVDASCASQPEVLRMCFKDDGGAQDSLVESPMAAASEVYSDLSECTSDLHSSLSRSRFAKLVPVTIMEVAESEPSQTLFIDKLQEKHKTLLQRNKVVVFDETTTLYDAATMAASSTVLLPSASESPTFLQYSTSNSLLLDSDVEMPPFTEAVSMDNSCSQDTGYQTGSLHTTDLLSQLAATSATASSLILGAPTLTADTDTLPGPDAAAEVPVSTILGGKQLTNTAPTLCPDTTRSNLDLVSNKCIQLASLHRYPPSLLRCPSLPFGPCSTISESSPPCSRDRTPLPAPPPHVFRLFGAAPLLHDAAAGDCLRPGDAKQS